MCPATSITRTLPNQSEDGLVQINSASSQWRIAACAESVVIAILTTCQSPPGKSFLHRYLQKGRRVIRYCVLPLLVPSFLITLILCCSRVAFARETDQFTTPHGPLMDVGPRLSRKVVEIIEADHSGEDPEVVLSRWDGRNFLVSRLVRWITAERRVGFRPSLSGSIFRLVLAPLPVSFFFDAPTVRVHGYYMGTDKIDHFFQQGHAYSELAKKYEAEGASPGAAIAAVVAHGVKQEHSYFGTATSGVYSNGDLAANYAGMKFYQNLQHSVQIAGRELPPLFQRTREGWRLRPGIDPESILRPFLSNHLDESLNPSRYKFSRKAIRAVVSKRCSTWTQFYAERLDLVAPAGQSFAATWFGEDYGHWLPPSEEVSIATECSAVVAQALTGKQ